jgi:hypothetical protein
MAETTDRGVIIHLAGRLRLSPALRDGAPALVGADAAGRCGWAEFFAAVERRGLAVAYDPEDPASISVVRRGAAPSPRPSRPSPAARVRAAVAEARRFLAALRGRPPAAP